MIITVVCDVLGEENNGTTVAAMNLIRYMKSRGDTVRILCADQSRIGEKDVFVVPNLDFGRLLDAYVNKVGVSLAKPDEEIICRALNGANAVHIMMPLMLGMATAKAAVKMHIPITAGFHMQAENFTSYIRLNKFKRVNKKVYRYIYQHLYRYCAGIHYPTEFIRNEFEKSIRKSTPGFVVSNGVNSYFKRLDMEKPDEFKDKIVILTTGRYAREKSQDTLIKAIKYSKHRENIQLILAGQGIKEPYYKLLSRDLPVAPVFKLCTREEILKIINYSDLYVHTAEIELEGISCIEAIACGKLTVVSDSKLSATKEFAVDSKCIFRNRNPKSLAKVIDYWIEHPFERAECEKKYLESAAVFEQNECMRRTRDFICRAVNMNLS